MIRNATVYDATCKGEHRKCRECKFKELCDYYKIYKTWDVPKVVDLLGQCMPGVVKNDMIDGNIILDTDAISWCEYNYSKRKDYVHIADIYVSPEGRGKHIAINFLYYLMQKYDCDIFAKCIADTESDKFWDHIATRVDNYLIPTDTWQQVRPNRRNLNWYILSNKNKSIKKENLW